MYIQNPKGKQVVLLVLTILPQYLIYHCKCQILPGNSIHREKLYFKAFRASFKIIIYQWCPIKKIHLIYEGKIAKGVGLKIAKLDSRLLKRFSNCTICHRFTIFKIPGRKCPQSLFRLYCSSAKEDFTIAFGNCPGNHLWILIMNSTTALTDMSRSIFALRYLPYQFAAALSAINHRIPTLS